MMINSCPTTISSLTANSVDLTAPETISRSRDMAGAHQNLNSSCDLTTPHSGSFAILGLALAAVNLPTKFEVSDSTYYEYIKGDTKCRNRVVWGSYGHQGHWK